MNKQNFYRTSNLDCRIKLIGQVGKQGIHWGEMHANVREVMGTSVKKEIRDADGEKFRRTMC